MARVCFVTGATGFVALNVIDELLQNGWEVHALHRKGSSRAHMLKDLPHAATRGRLVLVEGDLGCSLDEFANLVPDGTDVLYHVCHVGETTVHPLRMISVPGFQPEGADEHKQLNRRAMENVIHAAKERNVRRVVYCSSWSAYGRQPNGTDVTESTESHAHDLIHAACCCCGPPPTPVPYFECKYDVEHQLKYAVRDHGFEAVIIQPSSVFGRYGETGWCQIFARLIETNGQMPGLPGASSFCDVQDLASAFVAAADAGPGQGEAYIIGGTNASNLEMQNQMALLVGTPAPARATPTALLCRLARWNECLLQIPWLRWLRVKPDTIGSPWLMTKITQDQSTQSAAAQQALRYRPRPLAAIMQRNYEWLVESGKLPSKTDRKKHT